MIAVEVRKNLQPNPKTGKPLLTIENFLTAMEMDKRYANIRYNELTDRAEVHDIIVNGKPTVKKWDDTDEAASENYLESAYGLFSTQKHEKALRMLFKERRYNPIRDVVDAVKWDGVERCEEFLIRWAQVEDSAYSREVSRLIFAGGIHRLYAPGTKFDDVPILIGTKQGEGKSSLVRWLAIRDEWYGEVTLFDGQQAIEQLSGKWICEISELLALTKTKEQEAAKAYITRAVDSYRKPWDKNQSELPRRCIFIGTSNNANPLTDKTGNRRYYPVEVRCDGYDLYDHEDEIRAYIIQCWAEAREKYMAGKMPNYADRRLVDVYRQKQEEAMQDDWRVGAIMAYLDNKAEGEYTCVRELCHKALSPNPDFPKEPSLIESKDVGMIMNKMPGWERVGTRKVGSYGKQRAWIKATSKEENKTAQKQKAVAPIWDDDDSDELPF